MESLPAVLTPTSATSPMLDLVYGKLGERWKFKEEPEDLPCLRTLSGSLATTVTADPSTWPAVVHEVIWAMESGLTYTRAVKAVVGGALAGPLSAAEVRRLIRRLPAVQAELRGLEAEHAESWLDETVDIADGNDGGDESSVARDKLRVDTRLTVAGMRAKERYKPSTADRAGSGGVTVNVLRLSTTPQLAAAAAAVIEGEWADATHSAAE